MLYNFIINRIKNQKFWNKISNKQLFIFNKKDFNSIIKVQRKKIKY